MTNCTASSGHALIRVSLFTFPNVNTNTVTDDINCSGSTTGTLYTMPKIPTSTYQLTGTPITSGANSGYVPITYTPPGLSAWTSTYQVTLPLGSPYPFIPPDHPPPPIRIRMASRAIFTPVRGGSDEPQFRPCEGRRQRHYKWDNHYHRLPEAPDSVGFSTLHTYFAGAIYAAEAALQAEKPQADAASRLIILGMG